jgi:hypothetical protein
MPFIGYTMPFISDIAIDIELINGSFTLTNGIGGGGNNVVLA